MLKVTFVQRILPEYRLSFFEKISNKTELLVIYSKGESDGTYVNSKSIKTVKSRVINSISILLRLSSKEIYIVFSPTILYSIHKSKPDVIVTEGATNLPNNILIFIYSFFFKIPVVWWDVGRDTNYKPSILRKIFDPILEIFINSSAIVAAYNYKSTKYFHNFVDKEKVVNVMNATSVGKIDPTLKVHDKFCILAIGAIEERKKLETLVDAIAQHVILNERCHIIFVGNGKHKINLENYCISQGLRSFEFKGALRSTVQKAKVFSQSDVLVAPGWSTLAIVESMGYGVPPITATYGGPEYDYIEHGVTGYLVNRGDSSSIQEHILKFIYDPDFLTKMSKNCLDFYKLNFSMGNMVNRMIHAIELAYKFGKL